MKLNNFFFTCYATAEFEAKQKQLCHKALMIGFDKDNFFHANDSWLKSTNFYKENENILKEKRGAGFWLWKPFLIKTALMQIPENSILVYLDSGDTIDNGFLEHLIPIMQKEDMLLLGGAYKNSDWTKRDCFYYMNCDTPEFHNATQLEAGVQIWKHTQKSLEILSEQLEYCTDRRILTDDANVCGLENIIGFQDHRHDQSVLTNLFLKYKLPVDDSSNKGNGWTKVYTGLRNYTRCNI